MSGVLELVAHVREEGGLGAIDLRQRGGTPALFFVGTGVGDGHGDLRGHELEETGIERVEADARADADHECAGRPVRYIRFDRHHDQRNAVG